jgi:hypothetical protein
MEKYDKTIIWDWNGTRRRVPGTVLGAFFAALPDPPGWRRKKPGYPGFR